jgi:DMSO/TMAO reductase YedYZ molybdopterin-dependent catalytic subunit
MTPRAVDWSLALLVGLLFATGVGTLFAGGHGGAWVFAAHGAGGFALGVVVGLKARRVRRRLRPGAGLAALAAVGLTLGSGWAWAAGADVALAGYNLLNLHFVLGALLTAAVLGHALVRARPPRGADLGRRQFLTAATLAAGGYALYQAQRPFEALLGLRGAKRRFTGSYEAASFEGNAFPSTSWVADHPRPLDPRSHRLAVGGAVEHPLELSVAELDAGDELVATLDCTGGFYSTQRWRGIRLERLLERAGPRARHLRMISHTGYRWSFDVDDARRFLLATHVGGERLSHEHGAPLRLVAPGRRGFQWVKWVAKVEVHEHPDDLAPASTVWSSFTAAGRGA